MNYQEAEESMKNGGLVTVRNPRNGQMVMGPIVSRNGGLFKIRSAEGTEIDALVPEKLSPARR